MTAVARKRVLVAVDDSDTSTTVAAFVSDFFDDLDVEILALHVGDTPAPWYPADITPGGLFPWPAAPLLRAFAMEADIAQTVRRRSEHVIERTGIKDDRRLAALQDPAATIRATAFEHDADLVVVGDTHRNLLRRLWSRSPARQLAHDARLPTLVVHRPRDHR